MPVVAVCVLLGALVGWFAPAGLTAPARAVGTWVHDGCDAAVLAALTPTGLPLEEATAVAGVVALLAPGALLLLLVCAVRAVAVVRRLASVALLAVAALSFWVVPPAQAFCLLALACVVGLALALVQNALVTIPLGFAVGVGVGACAAAVFSGLDPCPLQVASQLTTLVPAVSLRTWRLAAQAVALAPLVGASIRSLRN